MDFAFFNLCLSKKREGQQLSGLLFSGLWVGFRSLKTRVVLQNYSNSLWFTNRPTNASQSHSCNFSFDNWNSISFSLAMSPNTDTYLINICCAVGWGTWKLERVTLTSVMRFLDFLSWPVPGKVTVWLQQLFNLFVSDIIPFGAFSLSSAGGEFIWVHLITKIITV